MRMLYFDPIYMKFTYYNLLQQNIHTKGVILHNNNEETENNSDLYEQIDGLFITYI